MKKRPAKDSVEARPKKARARATPIAAKPKDIAPPGESTPALPACPIAAAPEDEPRWFISARSGGFRFASYLASHFGTARMDPSEAFSSRMEKCSPWQMPLAVNEMIEIPTPLLRAMMAAVTRQHLRNAPDKDELFFRFLPPDFSSRTKEAAWDAIEKDLANALSDGRAWVTKHYFNAWKDPNLEGQTPALTESEVSGECSIRPNTLAENMQAEYWDRLAAIHQESLVLLKLRNGIPLTGAEGVWWHDKFATGLCTEGAAGPLSYRWACKTYLPSNPEILKELDSLFQEGSARFESSIAMAHDEIARLRNPSRTREARKLGRQAEDAIAERLIHFGVPDDVWTITSFGGTPIQGRGRYPRFFSYASTLLAEREQDGDVLLARILDPIPTKGNQGISLIEDRSEFPAEFWNQVGIEPLTMPHLDSLCAWWHGKDMLGLDHGWENLAVWILLSILADWWEGSLSSQEGETESELDQPKHGAQRRRQLRVKKKRGPITDPKELRTDERIWKAWKTGDFDTHEDCGREFDNMPGVEVRRRLDRHGKRIKAKAKN